MSIVIANRQRTKKINARLLRQVVSGLFDELKIAEGELGINFVGAKEMAKVNWNYLRHAGSTDVITFGYANPESRIQNPELKIHGELFVCVDEAVWQAKKFKTSWQSEAVRYVIHGILHLLGHDDLKPRLRRKMKRVENKLLRQSSERFSLAQIGRASKIRA